MAIAAEVVAVRRGGTALPLRHTSGPLHHDHPDDVAVRTYPGPAARRADGSATRRSQPPNPGA